MRAWVKRNWWLVLLLSIIALVPFAIQLHCTYKCKAYRYANEYCLEWGVCGWLHRMVNDPVALFTLVLTVATIGMWFVMHRTLLVSRSASTAAVNASEAAKSSASAAETANELMREATRAHFIFVDVKINEKERKATYHFRNHGGSDATVHAVGISVQPKRMKSPQQMFYQSIETIVGKGSPFRREFQISQAFDRKGVLREFAVRFEVVYSSVGLRRAYTCSWSLFAYKGKTGMQYFGHSHHGKKPDNDRPVPDDYPKQGPNGPWIIYPGQKPL